MAAPRASANEVEETLASIARRFPLEQSEEMGAEVMRIAFYIDLILSRKGRDVTVCDIGGGRGLFSLGCAALGMKSILVDVDEDRPLALHRQYGVEVILRDVIEEGIDFPSESLDVVTAFHTIEHFHHSPKRLLRSVTSVLKPGGIFALGAPNCVNLRKRLTVPLGHGKWSTMDRWYEADRFIDHVREPDVDDLRYIANDMGLVDVEIHGRNFLGLSSPKPFVRRAALLLDKGLRYRPSLCSDIYMLASKPA